MFWSKIKLKKQNRPAGEQVSEACIAEDVQRDFETGRDYTADYKRISESATKLLSTNTQLTNGTQYVGERGVRRGGRAFGFRGGAGVCAGGHHPARRAARRSANLPCQVRTFFSDLTGFRCFRILQHGDQRTCLVSCLFGILI